MKLRWFEPVACTYVNIHVITSLLPKNRSLKYEIVVVWTGCMYICKYSCDNLSYAGAWISHIKIRAPVGAMISHVKIHAPVLCSSQKTRVKIRAQNRSGIHWNRGTNLFITKTGRPRYEPIHNKTGRPLCGTHISQQNRSGIHWNRFAVRLFTTKLVGDLHVIIIHVNIHVITSLLPKNRSLKYEIAVVWTGYM